MRLAFALLVLALIAVSVWALVDDAFPQWRRYQRELVTREVVRLERELAEARADRDRPEMKARIARLDELIRAADADTSATALRAAALREGLSRLDEETRELRRQLRDADVRRRDPEIGRRRQEVLDALAAAQDSYARETGRWPPDTLRLSRLWTVRDSISDVLQEVEGPVPEWRARLEEVRDEAAALRSEAATLAGTRDSLETVRAQLLAPVSSRESALERLRRYRPRIEEIVSPNGRDVARCPTCHGRLDDPPGSHPPLPSEGVFREVPCTVCHRGHGRALTVAAAHEGLLTGAGFGAGPASFRARIERLSSADGAEREAAREELRKITGIDPTIDVGAHRDREDPDSAAVAAWTEWWREAESYFEPVDREGSGPEDNPFVAAGIDPWEFSTRGRPLRYVGSRKCLGCHETLHREHVRRWLATKFRSFERLVDAADPTPCLPCHTTGYDAARGAWAEPGVTCEGCHGPGERYNEMMVVGQELLAKGDESRGRALLAHASRLAREAVSRRHVEGDAGDINVCVGCHHPRRHRDGGPGVLERTGVVAGGE